MTTITPLRTDGFLPLGQYAALGDGRSVALVSIDGAVDWWCVPDIDSPPLLDRLLDPQGSVFSVTPRGSYSATRAYRPDSNVLETTFTTSSGIARVTESLNSGGAGRLPWSELARRIEGIVGQVEFDIRFRPVARPGRPMMREKSSPNGEVYRIGDVTAMVRGAEGEATDDGVETSHTTRPGSRKVIALLAVRDGPLIVPSCDSIDGRIDGSDAEWREWTARLTYAGRYVDAVRRSALALKLLLFSPTGAIAAAATTSMPERIGGDKNYDYRFAWVRDAAYTTKAFLRLGALEEAKAAFDWGLGTLHQHGLRPLYTLKGEVSPRMTKADLPGYRGSIPVRIGNAARSQRQLGMYGDILETAALFVQEGHILDNVTRKALFGLADDCAGAWVKKDAGMWELEENQHYTMSKIGCWMALDRAIGLANGGHLDSRHVGLWERQREQVREWIDAHCWSEDKQSYMLHAGSDRLDASLLLATRFRFERMDRLDLTRAAIQRELCRGSLVYRYSGMDREEGVFLACSFWLVEAFAFLGRPDEARRTLDELLGIVGGGILGEMVDPETHEVLGNLPQGLSHLAMIHAALAIEEAEGRDG